MWKTATWILHLHTVKATQRSYFDVRGCLVGVRAAACTQPEKGFHDWLFLWQHCWWLLIHMCELNTPNTDGSESSLPAAEACPAPAAAHLSCTGNPVALIQLWVVSSSGVSYLVAVYSVLGCPGCYRDGVWLAAAVSLTVSVFTSLPAETHSATRMNVKGLTDEVNNHFLHISYHHIIISSYHHVLCVSSRNG